MHSRKSLLLWAAAFALALPLFFSGIASAVYLPDGAVQSATTGTWDLPQDLGVCVTGIHADGSLAIDNTITNRRDCLANVFADYTTRAACGSTANTEGAHLWTNTCLASNGTTTVGVSLKGLDLNATMCRQKAAALGLTNATYGSACTSNWQYAGTDAVYADGQYQSGGFDRGFCYAKIDITSAYSTQAACIGYNSTSTPNLNNWSGGKCSYNFAVNGGVNYSAITAMDGTATLAAGGTVPNLTGMNFGQCLLAGYSWNNYYVQSGTTTMAGATVATIASGGNVNCLRCHNSVSQYNSVAERWKESYLLQGHKNMLRKVTAGEQWAGPDANGNIVPYTGSAYSDGTIDWTNATAGSSNLPLLYIFGDWMAPAPGGLDVIVNNNGHALYNGANPYSCSACHSTGFSNQTPAYCNGNLSMTDKGSCDAWKYPTGMASNQRSVWIEAGVCTQSSYVNSTDCAAAGATWKPSTGIQASLYPNGGIEPENTYPGLNWGSATAAWKPAWDQNGIQCSRCHAVTMPEVYDAGNTAASGNGHDWGTAISTGSAITNMCFGCHQATAKTNSGTGPDVDLNNPATPGLNGTNNGFTGHPIGEWFLNSPHARFSGTMAPNALGKYDIGTYTGNAFVLSGTFNTAFNDGYCSVSTYVDTNGSAAEVKTHADCTTAGGTWSYRTDQGTCTSCHDVHNSLFVASESEKAIKKECVDCHTTTTAFGTDANKTAPPTIDLSVMAHPRTANTPFDVKFGSPCETCHMPSDPGTKFAMHLWRINTDPNYSTFPTSSQVSAGQKLPNTAPDDKGYANAIWVDIDLACGQCHESTGANYVSGNPLLTKTQLAVAASGIHTGDSNLTNDQCLTCHNVAQGGYDAVVQGTNHHNGTCTECHGTTAWPLHQKVTTFTGNPVYSGGLDTPGTGCLACHDGRTGVALQPASGFANIIPDGAQDNHHSDHGNCTACHGPHGGLAPVTTAASGIYAGQTKSLATDGNDFCLCCHSNSGGYGKHHAVPALKAAGKNCWDCHGTVDAPAGSYANAGVPGVAAPEDNTACLQCHGSNTFTSTTGATVRQVNQGSNHHNGTCTTCHKKEMFTYLATGDLSTTGTVTALQPMSNPTLTTKSGKVAIDTTIQTACLSCHSTAKTRSADGSALAAIVQSGAGDNHHQGHAYIPGASGNDPGSYCLGCHGSIQVVSPVAGSTYSITASGLTVTTTSAMKGMVPNSHNTPGINAVSTLCVQCHSDVDSGHGTITQELVSGSTQTKNHHSGDCLNCHVPDQPGGPGITSDAAGNPQKPGDISSWADCTFCHGATPKAGTIQIIQSGATQNHHAGTCETCHSAAGVPASMTTPTTGVPAVAQKNPTYDSVNKVDALGTGCLFCHGPASTSPNSSIHVTSSNYPNGIVPDKNAITYGYADNHHSDHGTCTQCHGADGGVLPAVISAQNNYPATYLADDATSSLCRSCHGKTVVQLVSATTTTPQNHHNGACLSCHQPGQTGGPGITTDITGASVKPSTIPTWADCTACHNTINDGSQNGPGAGHHLTETNYTTCSSCHVNAGVKPSCSTCHTEAQPTLMAPTATSGCTACHVTNVTGGAQAGVAPTITQACDKCHGGATSTTTAAGAPYFDEPTLTTYGTNIHGTNPTAKFSWSNSSTADYTVLLDASNTTCPSGSCTYNWNFGDNSTGTGVTAAHVYTAGSYTVTLTVGTSTASAVVTPKYIGSNPTAMTASAVTSGLTSTVTYNVTGGVSPYTVKITWGDGTTTTGSSASASVGHSYAAVGTYSGTVYAVDSGVNGSMKTSATVTFSATTTMSSVTGTVYQSNGTTTVSGVYLYLMQGTTTKKIAVTSATGTYSFTNVPAGSYTIKAVKSGYTFQTPAASITVSGNMTQNINSVTP